jgi:hypothetical protein
MHTQTTETLQYVTDEKLATLSRSRWYRIRITGSVATAAGVLDVRDRVVGAEASRPAAPECGARAGNPSSRLGRSDRDPPSSICRFVSNAARGQRRLVQAGS